MKEAICKRCGVLFSVDETVPEFECTCQSKEFTLLN